MLDEDMNITTSETDIYRMLLKNSCTLSNDLLELQQIEYEQCIILAEIDRIDAEKQRLKYLLDLLQSTKSNGRKKSQKHQLKRINSNPKSD
ncbi:unnamed protein product [Adineta steineri]|uniref:Uncharacterized protein n=1 Tax=Adineta steineri TaxID=433720 RepID=A0A814N7V0_9BILA|nr:unnamed protein product [Adineta steineri]CAF1088317.1 unnamed protein product [Adineta steineri]CAF3502696.1 unnamed protein product [Adineta steineri]CAF3851484.1 unnamed protein product [Adineta steineri]CAF4403986.1 unnamed protein product [Adineta steineri]